MYYLLSTGLLGSLDEVSVAKFGHEVRATAGTLRNPNALAIFLVLTIPCVIYAMEKQIISRRQC